MRRPSQDCFRRIGQDTRVCPDSSSIWRPTESNVSLLPLRFNLALAGSAHAPPPGDSSEDPAMASTLGKLCHDIFVSLFSYSRNVVKSSKLEPKARVTRFVPADLGSSEQQ